MADEAPAVRLEVRFAWWLEPYLHLPAIAAVLSRREPDWGRLGRVIDRAIIISIAP